MRCANCARDIPAGARYCVHCGAEQAVPTPIAAVAAAIAQRGGRALPQAANAAQAEPAANEPRRAAASLPANDARPSRGPPKADVVAHPRANDAREALPAYASTPRRAGVALTLIVACFAVAVAAFFAWRMLERGDASRDGSKDVDDSIMSSFPPDATPARPNRPAPSEGSPPAAPPLAAGGAASTDREPTTAMREPLPTPPTGAVSSEASRATTAPPVEITPLPAKPSARSSRRMTEHDARVDARAALPPAPAPSGAAAARAPASTPPSTAVAAAPKAASPSVDPLARLREELASCTREDFIGRVVCGQRARFRHCEGYWGKVPECPGNPAPDHGQ